MPQVITLPTVNTFRETQKMNYLNNRISIDPDICNGKPTVRGKRITVQTILEFLSAGESRENILKQYPSLTSDDITSCLPADYSDEYKLKTELKALIKHA
ncbi:MAG: DUF433 domain-containing protein [Methylococcaceae bacterium]